MASKKRVVAKVTAADATKRLEATARRVTRAVTAPPAATGTGVVVHANGQESRRLTVYLPRALCRELIKRAADRDVSYSALAAEYLAAGMGIRP